MSSLNKNAIKKELAINLRRFRNEQNMTQEKLSEKIGIDIRLYQKYENSNNPTIPTVLTILKILKALNIDLKDLVKY